MRCILHIGTEKTGTKSLQEFLFQNPDVLSEHGYLYTSSAGLPNNRALAVAAFNADRRDDFTQAHGIRTDRDLIAYQNATIKALRAELEDIKGTHTVIFSSEHIQSRLRTEPELFRLKSILNELGFKKISILVYLRAPVEIVNSLYSTSIMSGATTPCPPGPENEYWHNLCDHRKTILRFGNYFGKENIIPRIFGREDLVNQSIIDDFAEAIELPFSIKKCVLPGLQNESMSALGLEILRRINREIPVFGRDLKPNQLRGNIPLYAIENLKTGDPYALPIELQYQYEEAFKESNEWVRSEYFPNR